MQSVQAQIGRPPPSSARHTTPRPEQAASFFPPSLHRQDEGQQVASRRWRHCQAPGDRRSGRPGLPLGCAAPARAAPPWNRRCWSPTPPAPALPSTGSSQHRLFPAPALPSTGSSRPVRPTREPHRHRTGGAGALPSTGSSRRAAPPWNRRCWSPTPPSTGSSRPVRPTREPHRRGTGGAGVLHPPAPALPSTGSFRPVRPSGITAR